MASKNILTDGKSLGIAGGILSILGAFLPWFHASANAGMLGISSSISVNGLGWKTGEGVLLGLANAPANGEFQGIQIIENDRINLLLT